MSYEICYSRAFIKTNRGIIPLVLSGSNNCTEFKHGKERRERDWGTFYGNRFIEKNASEILDFFKNKDDKSDFCKYRGKWLNYCDAYDFYLKGIKNALYLEEYLKNGLFRNTQGRTYGIHYLKCYVHNWAVEHGKIELEKDITTTEDLEAWLDDARAYIGNDNNNKFICFMFNDNEAISVRKKTNIKGACIIKDKNWFLSTNDAQKWECAYDVAGALIFDNAEQAEKHIEAMREKWGSSVNRLKIVKYDANKKEQVKNCYIHINNFGYFVKFTRYGYRYTYSLCDMNKMTQQRAKQVLKKLTDKFSKYIYELVKEAEQCA